MPGLRKTGKRFGQIAQFRLTSLHQYSNMSPKMRTIKLTIEYDGTAYAGWQVQPNGTSIQELMQGAIAAITGEAEVAVIGSGRTDAGVHAAGQVAHFKTETAIPAANLVHALNTQLPDDIAVIDAEDAPDDFHARYSAHSKTYRYTILNRPVRSPLARRRSYHIRSPLDLSAMRAAASLILGEHDFAAFQSKPNGKPSVRTVSRLELIEEAPFIHIEISANGFLYNMVRAIVGTLVEVGLGRRDAESVAALIASRDRSAAGPTAPPQGLCLMRVEY
jgi:tRNA pseudouridine38-40 synthase